MMLHECKIGTIVWVDESVELFPRAPRCEGKQIGYIKDLDVNAVGEVVPVIQFAEYMKALPIHPSVVNPL